MLSSWVFLMSLRSAWLRFVSRLSSLIPGKTDWTAPGFEHLQIHFWQTRTLPLPLAMNSLYSTAFLSQPQISSVYFSYKAILCFFIKAQIIFWVSQCHAQAGDNWEYHLRLMDIHMILSPASLCSSWTILHMAGGRAPACINLDPPSTCIWFLWGKDG